MQHDTPESVVLHAVGAHTPRRVSRTIGWRSHFSISEGHDAQPACEDAVKRGWMQLRPSPKFLPRGTLTYIVTVQGMMWAAEHTGLRLHKQAMRGHAFQAAINLVLAAGQSKPGTESPDGVCRKVRKEWRRTHEDLRRFVHEEVLEAARFSEKESIEERWAGRHEDAVSDAMVAETFHIVAELLESAARSDEGDVWPDKEDDA